MASATVDRFNSGRGYAFISQVNGPDVFAHVSALQGRASEPHGESEG
jgi:cold shock CspA family protein